MADDLDRQLERNLAAFAAMPGWKLFLRDPFGRRMDRLIERWGFLPTGNCAPPTHVEILTEPRAVEEPGA